MKEKLCQKANATNIHNKNVIITRIFNEMYFGPHFNQSSNVSFILFKTNKQKDDGAFSYYNSIRKIHLTRNRKPYTRASTAIYRYRLYSNPRQVECIQIILSV